MNRVLTSLMAFGVLFGYQAWAEADLVVELSSAEDSTDSSPTNPILRVASRTDNLTSVQVYGFNNSTNFHDGLGLGYIINGRVSNAVTPIHGSRIDSVLFAAEPDDEFLHEAFDRSSDSSRPDLSSSSTAGEDVAEGSNLSTVIIMICCGIAVFAILV